MSQNVLEMTPVRAVGMITSVGSYHGFVWCETIGRQVGVESRLEGDTTVVFDLDPQITWLCEQPKTFKVPFKGKTKSYTPDFVIVRNGRSYFVEVKPWKKANKAEMREWFAFLKRYFAKLGHGFIVLTEREIQRQPRLRNAELIRRYADGSCNDGHVIRLKQFTKGERSISLGKLQSLAAANDNLPNAYSFIKSGRARIDMSKPVNDNTTVSLTA